MREQGSGENRLCCGIFCRQTYFVAVANICRRSRHTLREDDENDDFTMIIVFTETSYTFFYILVESSMQLFTEIYGYLCQHVKRTCIALSDPSIYAEICTFLERVEDNGPFVPVLTF